MFVFGDLERIYGIINGYKIKFIISDGDIIREINRKVPYLLFIDLSSIYMMI